MQVMNRIRQKTETRPVLKGKKNVEKKGGI